MRLRASRYNHLHEADGELWGFHARTGALVRFNAETATIISTAESQSVPLDDNTSELVHAGFLIEESTDEVLTVRDHAYNIRYRSHSLDLVIAPTMDCNMACRYCFEQSVTPDYMTEPMITGVLDLMGTYEDKLRAVNVIWYGGEPLLSMDLMEKITCMIAERAQAAGARYEAMILTNGLLLTDATAKKLAELHVKRVQVTVDGSQSNHDRNRIGKDGRGTWQTILNNVCVAAEHVPIIVRATLSPDTVHEVYELCDTLDELGTPDSVIVSPAPLDPTRHCGESCQINPEFNRQLYREVLVRGYQPSRLEIRYPRPYSSCIGSRNLSFLIDAAGDIHCCLENAGRKERAIGSIFSDPVRDHRYQPWLQADPFFEGGQCMECKWLPLCLGGCPLVKVRTGSRHCIRMKGSMELWMQYQAMMYRQRTETDADVSLSV